MIGGLICLRIKKSTMNMGPEIFARGGGCWWLIIHIVKIGSWDEDGLVH